MIWGMKSKIINLPTHLPVSFEHSIFANDGKLVIFLHGYTDSGSALMRRIGKGGELSYSLIAPNGPFPLPVKSGETYKEAYAWYFWDPVTNKILISPDVAAELIEKLINALGYMDVPKIVVGFSQGAFLAPYLFPRLRNIRGAIAVGAAFREEAYTQIYSFPLFAIHGDQDEIIPLERSRKSFLQLLETKKIHGQYFEIAGAGHSINKGMATLIQQKIKEIFGD
jgi:predicted esterase